MPKNTYVYIASRGTNRNSFYQDVVYIEGESNKLISDDLDFRV